MTKIAMEGSERASRRLARRVPREGVPGRRRKVPKSRLRQKCRNPRRGGDKKRSRGANPRLREVSAKIGFLEPYVGQEPELIETGNSEVLIFVVTVLELEVKVFVEAEIGADRIHVVGSC